MESKKNLEVVQSTRTIIRKGYYALRMKSKLKKGFSTELIRDVVHIIHGEVLDQLLTSREFCILNFGTFSLIVEELPLSDLQKAKYFVPQTGIRHETEIRAAIRFFPHPSLKEAIQKRRKALLESGILNKPKRKS